MLSPHRLPTPAVIRYAGLLGSVLLAVAAHLGGVRSPWRPNTDVVDLLRGGQGVLMPLCWLAGITLLIGAWWAGTQRVPSTRWAYVTAGLWLLPLLLPPVLGSRDIYSYACQGSVLAAGKDPYAAGLRVLGCPWIESTAPIWRDSPAPYGPFFVVLAGGAAALGGSLAATLLWLRVVAVAGVLLTAVCLPVLARRAGVQPDRAVWLVLACPLVGVHLVSGAHNDAVMVGLLVAGLTVLARSPARPPVRPSAGPPDRGPGRRPRWSPPGGSSARFGALLGGGVLLGLAVAVKVTALVVVPFGALLAVGGAYRTRLLLTRGGTVVAAAVGALTAVSAASGLGLGWIRGLVNSGDSVQWTSPATAVGLTVDYLGRPFGLHLHAVPVTRVIGVVLLVVVLVVLWWRARHGDPLLGAGLALTATVVLSPVFHPWYATWPLAVLAATWSPLPDQLRRRLLAPCAVAAALTLPDGTSLALVTRFPGALVMTAVVVIVVVVAVRRARTGAPGPMTLTVISRGTSSPPPRWCPRLHRGPGRARADPARRR